MAQRFLMRLAAFAVAMAVLVIGAGVALAADGIDNDQDLVQNGQQGTIDKGAQTRGTQFTATPAFSLVYNGNKAHVASGSTVVLELDSAGSTSGVAADDVSFLIPNSWGSGDSVRSTTTVRYTPGATEAQGSHTIRAAFKCKSGCTDENTPDVHTNDETLSTNHARVDITYSLGAITSGGGSTTPADTTAPSIAFSDSTPDGTNGWFKTSPATVKVTATDASGIASLSCTLGGTAATLTSTGSTSTTAFGTLSTSTDGTHNYSCTATDTPGNAMVTAATTTLKLDTVAPTVTCNAATFLVNQPDASVTGSVSDATSLPVTTTASTSVSTTTMGAFTDPNGAVLTGTDNAGNSASRNCAYSVTATATNFGSPVDAANKAKAGQSIPLKWRLTDYFGAPVTSLSSVLLGTKSCATSGTASFDPLEEYASAGSSGLQNLGDGYYQYNWKTPTSFATLCKEITLSWNGGKHGQHPTFQFTK